MEVSKTLRCAVIAARVPRGAPSKRPFGCLVYRPQAPRLFLPAMPYVVLEEGEEQSAARLVRDLKIPRRTRFAEIRLPNQAPLAKGWVQIHGDPARENLSIVEQWLQHSREIEALSLPMEDGRHRFVIDTGVISLSQQRVLDLGRQLSQTESLEGLTVRPEIQDRLDFFEAIAEMAGSLISTLKF